ncbi:PDZ/DHR/GLGF domain protein [Ancylostoma duodenale]|uniref:PDZ/DHR/GLGF domain protein n=1 Tax=Ancylostoma duodenale TaxID=51022 RepID=A0A0C2DY89_9BILA|nr:PDZ/DHR/GLGF domain protein [Ancylostoma duodenale]
MRRKINFDLIDLIQLSFSSTDLLEVVGLGDAMNPYLGTIRDNCTEAPSENLQSLSMKVVIACKAVALELGKALRCRDEKPLTRNHVVAVLNSISLSMSVLVEHVKKLVFWLDRSPFDELVQYIELRNRVSVSIWDLVRSVNVQPKSLFGVASEIIQKTNDLREVCENVVRNSDDPAILYTAYVERALLRRHDGINLQSSFRGVHVISEVKVGSPADLCCRIDAGDEIMLINGKTVVGWDLTRVAQRLGSSTDTELHLVLNKRPRHSLPLPLKNSAKPTRPLAKMIPGSQATDTADRGKRVFKEIAYPLNRRRSSTFVAELINLQSKGARIRATRRSSICGGSPRRELYFEEDERPYVNWDLFDLIGHPAADSHEGSIAIPRIVRRARTMRHQPDGYVRSFIDNKLVHEIEDDTITEQLPFNVKCPTEFAEVSIVEPVELSHLNVAEPSCSDPEWSAPYEEVCLPRFRAPAGDSNLSGLVLDSPRFTTSSTGDDPWVLPSPASVSSIPSISSPNPFRLTASGDWHNEETPSTPSTPDIKTTEKAFEGWTRRADMIINIAKCTVSDETELKTSKKFVFRLSRPPMEHHFSCYNQTDMRT